jgi:hypothetical protein
MERVITDYTKYKDFTLITLYVIEEDKRAHEALYDRHDESIRNFTCSILKSYLVDPEYEGYRGLQIYRWLRDKKRIIEVLNIRVWKKIDKNLKNFRGFSYNPETDKITRVEFLTYAYKIIESEVVDYLRTDGKEDINDYKLEFMDSSRCYFRSYLKNRTNN